MAVGPLLTLLGLTWKPEGGGKAREAREARGGGSCTSD